MLSREWDDGKASRNPYNLAGKPDTVEEQLQITQGLEFRSVLLENRTTSQPQWPFIYKLKQNLKKNCQSLRYTKSNSSA